MNHLHRSLAPIGDAAWGQLEDEARNRLVTYLAARKLVDFAGPHGWEHAAVNLGRADPIDGPNGGVDARRRRVLPLVELRASFTLPRRVIDDAERGATDLDLGPLDAAAQQVALAENVAVFHGYPEAGIVGMTEASSEPPITPEPDMNRYPTAIARAVNELATRGIIGPYGLAIGPDGYTRIVETAEHGGYPLLDHLRKILEGPVVWAPGVQGAIVASMRGGDFRLDVGQDLAIGYSSHDGTTVTLYLEESMTFRVLEPDAAVHLT